MTNPPNAVFYGRVSTDDPQPPGRILGTIVARITTFRRME